jgi:hypothetical protein
MADECKGWWTSKIKGVDDGRIEIEEAADGAITGKHHKSQKPIAGQCTGGGAPRITFSRTGADDCTYIYFGEIIEVLTPVKHLEIKPGTGKVIKICKPFPDFTQKAKPAPPPPPDDWVAEKDPT